MTITLPTLKPGARMVALENQLRAIGNPCHAQAGFVEVRAEALFEARDDLRVMVNGNAKRLRHAVGGDVVMGWPDAASGKDVGVTLTERVQCVDNGVLFIGDHADFLEIDADIREVFGDEADVLVLGSPRQDFVADHQNAGGHDVSHLLLSSLS
jgi:hypothetical protein